MKVLVVYAHPNPKSFNHAVLDSFTKGLKEVGHSFDVVDLFAEKFNPSIQIEDFVTYPRHVYCKCPFVWGLREMLDKANL